MRRFARRLVGAALVDVAVYEEVEADSSATVQAMAVVTMASIATGLGVGARGGLEPSDLVYGALVAWGGWMLWAAATHLIGTRLLPTPATDSSWGQLLRTTGFSAAPGLLRVLAAAPGVWGLVLYYAATVWMLVAFVVAVRQALDYSSTWRAVGVCLTGWLLFVILGNLVVPAS